MFKALLLLFLINPAEASTPFSSRGELRLESRFFTDDKNDQTQDFGYGMAARIEVSEDWKNFSNRLQVFSRVDRKDPSRQRLNIEEAYIQWLSGNWVLFGGYKILNWSTAEAFHPTDVINARNFDGPFENAEKVGELMTGFQYLSSWINFSAFFMPLLNRPQLPEAQNRLSFFPQGIAADQAQFVNNDGKIMQTSDLVNQWAMRAQFPTGDWEFNLYWVHHFDRTDFRPVLNLNTGTIVPLLSEVDHYGFAFQYVYDAFIFKSENVFRDFKETLNLQDFTGTLTREDYFISSLALEYLMSHSAGSESTIILEFQEIYGPNKNYRYQINPFQRDLLLGFRHAFNDVNGKEFFVGVIGDLERGKEILAMASYSQRLSDVWKINLGARYIDAPPAPNSVFNTGMTPLNNDHQFNLSFSRFF